jgi:hypothetical protein
MLINGFDYRHLIFYRFNCRFFFTIASLFVANDRKYEIRAVFGDCNDLVFASFVRRPFRKHGNDRIKTGNLVYLKKHLLKR